MPYGLFIEFARDPTSSSLSRTGLRDGEDDVPRGLAREEIRHGSVELVPPQHGADIHFEIASVGEL